MRPVFDCIQMHVDDKRYIVQELKKQMHMRSFKLSLNAESKNGKSNMLCTSKWLMKDMKDIYEKQGLHPTCSVKPTGSDVRVLDWKKKGE